MTKIPSPWVRFFYRAMDWFMVQDIGQDTRQVMCYIMVKVMGLGMERGMRHSWVGPWVESLFEK